jgi:hypothetical protein
MLNSEISGRRDGLLLEQTVVHAGMKMAAQARAGKGRERRRCGGRRSGFW